MLQLPSLRRLALEELACSLDRCDDWRTNFELRTYSTVPRHLKTLRVGGTLLRWETEKSCLGEDGCERSWLVMLAAVTTSPNTQSINPVDHDANEEQL